MIRSFWGEEYLTEHEVSGWSIRRIHIVLFIFLSLPPSIRSQISSAIGSSAIHQAKTALKKKSPELFRSLFIH